MGNPIAWGILSLITIASFILTLIAWIMGRKRKVISSMSKSYRIIQQGEKGIPGLEIQYGNIGISDLTITMFVIWNSGNETIRCEDVVRADALRIMSDDENTRILNASIIKVSESSNLFEIETDENVVDVRMDYIEPGQGAVIQIMHTGDSSNISVQGKVKGGTLRKFKYENKVNENRKTKTVTLVVMMVFEMIALPIITLWMYLELVWGIRIGAEVAQSSSSSLGKALVLVFMTIVSSATEVIFYKELVRRFYLQIPRSLRNYVEYE